MLNKITLSDIYNREAPFASLKPGESIILIGAANKGPSMIPIKITSIDSAKKIFGEESQLANAYIECTNYANDTIYLLRSNGKHIDLSIQGKILLSSIECIDSNAKLDYNIYIADDKKYLSICRINKEIDFEQIIVKDTNITTFELSRRVIRAIKLKINDKEYYNFHIESNGRTVVLNDVITMGAIINIEYEYYLIDNQIVYSLDNKKIEDIVKEINIDALNKKGYVYVKQYESLDTNELIEEDFNIVRNMTYHIRTNNDPNYKNSIEDILDLINIYPIQQIGFLDREFDEKNLYQTLSSYVEEKNLNGMPCLINLGLNDITDLENRVSEFETKLTSEIEVSEFINIILFNGKIKYSQIDYLSNGVGILSGLLNNYDTIETPNNKIINIVAQNLLNINQSIIDKGFITIRKGYDNQWRSSFVTNLSKLTNIVVNRYFNVNIPEEGVNIRTKRTIPIGLSNSQNVRLIQDIYYLFYGVDFSENFNNTIENIFHSIQNRIKSYSYRIEKERDGFTLNYIIIIDLVLYGMVDAINIDVKLW